MSKEDLQSCVMKEDRSRKLYTDGLSEEDGLQRILREMVSHERHSLSIEDREAMKSRVVRQNAGALISSYWKWFHTSRRHRAAVRIQCVYRGYCIRERFFVDHDLRFTGYIKWSLSRRRARQRLINELDLFNMELDDIDLSFLSEIEDRLCLQQVQSTRIDAVTTCDWKSSPDHGPPLSAGIRPEISQSANQVVQDESEPKWMNRRGKNSTHRRNHLLKKCEDWR
jgi:hypothetical protein